TGPSAWPASSRTAPNDTRRVLCTFRRLDADRPRLRRDLCAAPLSARRVVQPFTATWPAFSFGRDASLVRRTRRRARAACRALAFAGDCDRDRRRRDPALAARRPRLCRTACPARDLVP